MYRSGDRVFQAEGTAQVKALKWEGAWVSQGQQKGQSGEPKGVKSGRGAEEPFEALGRSWGFYFERNRKPWEGLAYRGHVISFMFLKMLLQLEGEEREGTKSRSRAW